MGTHPIFKGIHGVGRRNTEIYPICKTMQLQPEFNDCRVRGGKVSEDLFKRGLCLPTGTQMTEEALEEIGKVIKR